MLTQGFELQMRICEQSLMRTLGFTLLVPILLAWPCLGGKSGARVIVTSLAFSPDGKLAVSAGSNGEISLWSIANGQRLHTFRGHQDVVTAVAFSANGKTVVSGSRDMTVRFWDIDTGLQSRDSIIEEWEVRCVVYSPHGESILIGGGGGLRLLDPNHAASAVALDTQGVAIQCAVFSKDGKYIIAGSARGLIYLWEARTGKRIRMFVGHETASWVDSVSISSNGTRLISVGALDVMVWDVASGERLFTLNKSANTNPFTAAFVPNSAIAACTDDAYVYLWNTDSGEAVKRIRL